MKNYRTTSIQLSIETWNKIKKIANTDQRSVSFIIREWMILPFLKKHESSTPPIVDNTKQNL